MNDTMNKMIATLETSIYKVTEKNSKLEENFNKNKALTDAMIESIN